MNRRKRIVEILDINLDRFYQNCVDLLKYSGDHMGASLLSEVSFPDSSSIADKLLQESGGDIYMKHYREIKCEDRLPDKPGEYHTNMGLIYYKLPKWPDPLTDWTREYDGGGLFIQNEEVKYWLEEYDLEEKLEDIKDLKEELRITRKYLIEAKGELKQLKTNNQREDKAEHAIEFAKFFIGWRNKKHNKDRMTSYQMAYRQFIYSTLKQKR